MAIVQNPITGRSRQAYGPAIFQRWKDKNVLRTKPLTVHNPNTILQQLQRSKLAMMVNIYRNLKGLVDIGFKSQAISMTEYNAFMSENMRNATTDDGTTSTIIPENIVVAKGNMAQTDLTAAVNSDDVKFSWAYAGVEDLLPGQSKDDILFVAAATIKDDGSIDVFKAMDSGKVRSDTSYTFVDAADEAGSTNGIILAFFASPDLYNSEDSQNWEVSAI